MACQTGAYTRLESPRMASGLRTGRARIEALDWNAQIANGRNDWPGRTHGIRAPGLFETALSWDEVRVALAGQA